MTEKNLSIWELRPPYFKGVSGTYNLAYGDETVALEVDSKGRFNWRAAPIPIGMFAKFIGTLNPRS